MTKQIQEMSVNELLIYANEKNIDVSSVHTGKGFRKNKGTNAKYKKEDLIAMITDTQTENKQENTNEKTKEENKSNEKEEKLKDIDSFYKTVDKFAKKYYDELYQYTTNLLSQNTAFLPSFFNIVSSYGDSIKNHVNNVKEKNELSGNTLKNYHCQIMILIENKIIESDFKFPDNLLLKSFNTFVESTKNLFSLEFKQAIKTTGIHLNERQNNIIFIECKELLIFAKKTLTNLSNKPTAWKEIALSLMIVTGRRLTEIMFSASFEKIDDYTVKFIGQLKGVNYDINGYEIPVLVKSDLIINAINWLKIFGKRNQNDFIQLVNDGNIEKIKVENKKTHGQYARYLNEEIKNILTDYIPLENEDNWIIKFDDGKQKDRRTTHICRQIYAQIVYNIFYYRKQVRRKKHQILADILGHDYTSDKTRTASNNYDCDFEITDLDAIAELFN